MINYPFLEFDELQKTNEKTDIIINKDFKNIIVIGIGGSSQGSKAINHYLNETRVQYVDHLNSVKINELLNNSQLDETGFFFISKAGQIS